MSPTRKRVLVTRATEQAGKLSAALRAAGFEPVEVPVLEILPPESFALLDTALKRLGEYDWLILTSANTVRAIMSRAESLGLSLSTSKLKVAAIGSATAETARQSGLKVDLVPESYIAEGLVSVLATQISNSRILLARAAVARDVIPDVLRAAGAKVDVVEAYRNQMPAEAPNQLAKALQQGIDAVAFTSSSSVIHLADAAARAGLQFPFDGVAAISIGPITSQTLRAAGWEPAIEANPSDISGLVKAIQHFFVT